jgi:hypothetical protein
VVADGKEIEARKIEAFPDAKLKPGEVLIRVDLEGVPMGVPWIHV